MNKPDQTNRRSLFSLGTLVLMVPALRHFVTASAKYAGRAAWLTPLIAALPMLLYLHFIADFMGCRREGENLQELMLRCLGPKLGRGALRAPDDSRLTYQQSRQHRGFPALYGR